MAVYVTGDVSDHYKEYFRDYLLAALVRSGNYKSNDANSETFLTALRAEQSLRNDPVDDGKICELGSRFGIRYVCAASIIPVSFGTFTLSARIISTKTGKARFYGEATDRIVTIEDLGAVSGMVVEKMFANPNSDDNPVAAPDAKPAIAVYVTGGDSIPKTTKDALSTFFLDTLVDLVF